MLAEKNDKIAKAYTILEVMSQDRVARMAYEAREAEIRDQLTREEEAREAIEEGIQKGIQQGIEQGKIDMTRKMLEAGMEVAQVQQISGLSLEQIEQLKK
ncbi:MAG: Rpn family recombination-promoting nuclease/putative transposase [Cellulosilyticaceae bacterium]